jgi:MFS family permease
VTRVSPFASLRIPEFRWWFLAQIVSGSGNMAQGVGAAWLILKVLGGSSLDLGLLSAAMFTPVLLTGARAGVLLDHVDHRRALIVTQVAGGALALALGLLTTAGSVELWMVFVLAAAGGFVFAVDQPARQLYVIELVGRERVQSAVGLFEVILNASRVLGPALAGAVIAIFGVSTCFYVNAASYLAPLLVLLWLRPRERPEKAERPNTLSALREGLSFVRRSPAIIACLGMAATAGMLFNLGVALPVLATKALGLGSVGYGFLFAFFGIGAIPGGLAAARSRGEPRGRQVRLLCLITGIVVIATAFTPTVALAFPLIALAGFFSIWFIALANTLVQLRPEPRMRGRVMGLWTMALPGLNPVTGLLVGAATALIGARAGFALAGIGLAVAALLGWRALSDDGLDRSPGRVTEVEPREPAVLQVSDT